MAKLQEQRIGTMGPHLLAAVFIAFMLVIGSDAIVGILSNDRERGWDFGFALGGLWLVGYALLLLRQRPGLELLRAGLYVRTLWSTRVYRWNDITQFSEVQVWGTRRVSFDYTRHYQGQRSPALRERWGCDVMLPENYGRKPGELVGLLVSFQVQALLVEESGAYPALQVKAEPPAP